MPVPTNPVRGFQKLLTSPAPLQAVPASLTNFTNTDTEVYQLTLCATNGAALVTLQSQETTPNKLFFTLTNAQTQVTQFPEGVLFTSGVGWVSNVNGVTGSIVAKL